MLFTDTQEPELPDCPDLTFSTSLGLPTAYVTYDRPNATDNVAVMSVDCFGVDEDGQILDVGVHPVRCTATDTANLTGRCLFNITVEGELILWAYFPPTFLSFYSVYLEAHEMFEFARLLSPQTFEKAGSIPKIPYCDP